MPGNSFGKMFRIITFGESHGRVTGVVVDGVPAGLRINHSDIEYELMFRRPGRLHTSPRRELDKVEILSGVSNGRATGAPITITVENVDVSSEYYEELRYTPRPGHADLPYLTRYGFENWNYRGGGRASGRETVARVIAGAIAKKLLMLTDTVVLGCVRSIGPVAVDGDVSLEDLIRARCSHLRACKDVEQKFVELLDKAVNEGDSYGSIAEIQVHNPPSGLGEPVFDKIKADLAKAVMSIPGVVGFEYGMGFELAKKRGSEVLDEIYTDNSNRFRWRYNVSGGILGGITTGEPIVVRCAFKPTSSIRFPQKTVDIRTFEEKTIVVRGRHDPCIAIRGLAVVEAMVAIVLLDHAIRSGIIPSTKLSESDIKTIDVRWERYRSLCLPTGV